MSEVWVESLVTRKTVQTNPFSAGLRNFIFVVLTLLCTGGGACYNPPALFDPLLLANG